MNFYVKQMVFFSLLLLFFNLSFADKSLEEALVLATLRYDVDEVRQLIEEGADVNCGVEKNWDYPFFNGRTFYTTGAFDCGTYSPLMIATQRGYTDLVQLLIEEGALLNLKADIPCDGLFPGWSALKFAEAFAHTEIAKMLRSAGALSLELVCVPVRSYR